MKKKFILAAAVFAFAVFSLAWSYSGYGKKTSENTSGTMDGKVLVCRKYSEISKVLVIDSQKKSRKKEIRGWQYDTSSGELAVSEDLSDFASPIFHIEGKPVEPAQFILRDCDRNSGPTAVFLNGKVAAENREYVIDDESNILTLKISAKEISSIRITWHSTLGLSSISEMTQKESDLYAELEGAWFTENAKKSILAQTEYPVLEFENGTGSENGGIPKIVMKQFTDEERRKNAAEFPVNAYKIRRNQSKGKLSREAGFKINLPKKCGDYKIVSTMIIESSLKGEMTKTVEFSYDKGDSFSLESISVEAMKSSGENTAEKVEYPISTETLKLKFPVKKQVCWTISNTGETASENDMDNISETDTRNDMEAGTENNFDNETDKNLGGKNEISPYKPEKFCIYTWEKNGTLYKTQCLMQKSEEMEMFLAGL